MCNQSCNQCKCKKPKLKLWEKILLATIVFFIMFSAFVSLSFAQRVVTPIYVDDPYSLQMWLRGNFIYEREPLLSNGKRQDHWQNVVEFLSTKRGDCEDFAVLSSKVFTELLTWNNIVVIQFKGQSSAHAITVFKEYDGTLSYMSNQFYHKVNAETLEELLNKEYPNWSFAQITNNNGGVRQNIYRIKEEEPLDNNILNIINDLNERVNRLEEIKDNKNEY